MCVTVCMCEYVCVSVCMCVYVCVSMCVYVFTQGYLVLSSRS